MELPPEVPLVKSHVAWPQLQPPRGPAPSPPLPSAKETTASYNDDGATNVFEEMPESWDLHSVLPSCVDLVDKNAVSIDTTPLGAFVAGAEGGDEEGVKENGVDEIEEGGFDGSQTRHGRRSSNYTRIEDITLVKAWECVSLDAVADNDQIRKRYWQRIEDKFHRLMPVPSTRSLRSLQGRHHMIKICCSRWSACLEQVRNAPPSGFTIDDYDRIAMEMYKRMPASKKKPFVFQHCWKLLEHSEKWRLRCQEASPKKGAFIELDDDSDVPKGGISKGKPYIEVPLVESHVARQQLQPQVDPATCTPPDASGPPIPAAAAAKRKRQGNHIVEVALQVGAASSGFPLVPCRGRPKAAGDDSKRVKKVASQGPAPPPLSPGGEPTASYNDDGATNVFEETPESWDLHSVPPSCVDLLDKNAVSIDTTPHGAFDANAEEADEEGEGENGVEEIEEGVFDGSQPRKKRRSLDYTKIEDITLLKAWECVSLGPVASNGQTGKKYWQRIEDMFHRLMPVPSMRSLRSLQGRYDMIKSCCSRWSDCLEQVRNAPPSGCTIDDHDRIAMKRYKRMPASKNRPFVLQHCWELLEHSEKWSLRYQEAPPKKGAFVELDDDDSDASNGERNKAASLREKIDDSVKSKETLVSKQLEAEMAMAEKKQQDTMARWQKLQEVEERKIAIEERRVLLEENKLMAEILAEENKVMMMDPRGMDLISKEWWEIRRGEIMQRRRQASGGATLAAGGAGALACGGDGADKLDDDGVA